ncbi:MAG: A24 family peptidase [Bacillota bacterium]|nr:A24 family peptidase [Bacillota bacterium]
MSIIMVSIFSLILGAILSIVASRIPKGEEDVSWVWPFCNSCGKKLSLKEIFIPANLIIYKGKCPNCKHPTHSRSLQITLLTIFIYISLYLKFGITIQFFAFLILMSILIAVFFIDMDHKIIPEDLIIAGLAGGIPLFIYNIFYEFPIYMDRSWWNPLAGALSVSILLLLIAIIGNWYYKTDAMGIGDVKLFIPIGIFLGWRMVIMAFILSAFVGSFITIIMMLLKVKKLRDVVPFGPFIVTGTFLTILFGNDILNWYLQFYQYN